MRNDDQYDEHQSSLVQVGRCGQVSRREKVVHVREQFDHEGYKEIVTFQRSLQWPCYKADNQNKLCVNVHREITLWPLQSEKST